MVIYRKEIIVHQLRTVFFGLALSVIPAIAVADPTAIDVISAFKNAGLEAKNPTPMRPKDYGFAPYVCKGVRFLIPSLGQDNGGRIFACPNATDRDAIAGYYERLGKKSAAFYSWVLVKGNVVVQINGDLEEDKAKKYEHAIP